jgi:hypothetical protein
MNEVVSVTAIDSFSEDGGSDRLLQGSRVPCVDGVWTHAKNGSVITKDKRFLVLGTAEAQQDWEDGQLVEERIKKPNAPFLETINELNAQISQDRWEEGLNGPRPPWSLVFAVYLLDLTDGSIYTAMNSTSGMAAATRELKEKVKWMRALRGQTVNPIVTLGSQLHSKKWKKLRPSFDPVEWRDLSKPSQSPALAAPQAGTLLGVKVEEPSLAEQMNDEVPPFDDPLDEILDKPKPEITKKRRAENCRRPRSLTNWEDTMDDNTLKWTGRERFYRASVGDADLCYEIEPYFGMGWNSPPYEFLVTFGKWGWPAFGRCNLGIVRTLEAAARLAEDHYQSKPERAA